MTILLRVGALVAIILALGSQPIWAQFDEFDDDFDVGAVDFQVREGSLRYNIRRLAEDSGWRLVGWDQTVLRDSAVLDWQVLAEYRIEADSLDDALSQLIAPYGLHARIHEPDRAIAIYLFEKVRFSGGDE